MKPSGTDNERAVRSPPALVRSICKWLLVLPLLLTAVFAVAPEQVAPYSIEYEDSVFLPAGHGSRGGFHFLGTDREGRDFASILVRGTSTSLRYALLGTVLVVCGALILGFVQGYTRRRWLAILYGTMTLGAMALPDLAIIATVRGAWPRQLSPLTSAQLELLINLCLVCSIALLAIPIESRLIAERVRAIVTQRFVSATRALGGSALYIFLFEVFPLVLADLVWICVLTFPRFIHAEIGLAYLGLGFRGVLGLGDIMSTSFEHFQVRVALNQLSLCMLVLAWLSLMPQLVLYVARLFSTRKTYADDRTHRPTG